MFRFGVFFSTSVWLAQISNIIYVCGGRGGVYVVCGLFTFGIIETLRKLSPKKRLRFVFITSKKVHRQNFHHQFLRNLRY